MMLLILEVKYLIKVSDTRRADFTEECRRQSRLTAQADLADVDVMNFMDDVLVAEDGEDEGECYNFPSFHAKVNQPVKFSVRTSIDYFFLWYQNIDCHF